MNTTLTQRSQRLHSLNDLNCIKATSHSIPLHTLHYIILWQNQNSDATWITGRLVSELNTTDSTTFKGPNAQLHAIIPLQCLRLTTGSQQRIEVELWPRSELDIHKQKTYRSHVQIARSRAQPTNDMSRSIGSISIQHSKVPPFILQLLSDSGLISQ